jgi:dihydroneopterin aldolase
MYAYHGVLPIERTVGNMFEVSARLCYDATTAMSNDNIATALNYASVISEITQVMAVPQRLLEHVAHNIITRLDYIFPEITSGTLTVKKLKPPIDQQLKDVSFTVSWHH